MRNNHSTRLRVAGAILVLGFAAAGASAQNDFGTDGVSCNHATLAAALNAVAAGGTVYVRTGLHTLTGNPLGALGGYQTIGQDVTLQGSDPSCAAAGAGSATLSYWAGPGRILDVLAGSTLQLVRMTLSGGNTAANGGTLYLESGASLSMVESAIEGGISGASGGCVFSVGADVFVGSNSRISDCTATTDGGGVAMLNATLTVWGDVYDNQAVNGDGGNIYADTGTFVSLSGRVFSGHAGGNGGGVALVEVSSLEPNLTAFASAEIYLNSADGDGGGVWAAIEPTIPDGAGPSITLQDDARVHDNTAGGDGGGVYADGNNAEGPDVTLRDNAAVEINEATYGGGLAVRFTTLDLTDEALVFFNDAQTSGGGIHAWASTITATGAGSSARVALTSNDAAGTGLEGGGGLYLDASTFEGAFVELSSNVADGYGGGATLVNGATLKLTNSEVASNAAGTGGGIFANASTVEMKPDFTSCTAACGDYCSEVRENITTGGVGSGNGGGVALTGGSTATFLGTHFADNLAHSDGYAAWLHHPDDRLRLRNVLVEHNQGIQYWWWGTAVWAEGGTLHARNTTFVDNYTPVVYEPGTGGSFHGNIVTANVNDAVPGPVTGNCTLTQTAAGMPAGASNGFGLPTLDACYWPIAPGTNVADQCVAGPPFDIRGQARPLGASNDRGAVEGL